MTQLDADDADAVQIVTSALDAGDLAILPADEQYALAGDALLEEALTRLFEAQGRPADAPLQVCVGGVEEIHHVAYVTPLARDLAARFWPGPLALVLRARPWLPDALTAGGETVAVRAPANPFAQQLARTFGPFAFTNAAAHGAPPAATLDAARAALGPHARLFVDAGALPGAQATVVDAREDAPVVLREGARKVF